MDVQAIRLKPPRPTRVLGEYDVDAFVLEVDPSGVVIDFRLELGSGLETLWLVPIEPNGRLRLVHIGYITVDDDPYVVDDPAPAHFGPITWRDVAMPNGDTIIEVTAVLTRSPPAYRIEARVGASDGSKRSFLLAWTG